MTRLREWLRIQAALGQCVPRLIAAISSGNDTAERNVIADINRLHEEWASWKAAS